MDTKNDLAHLGLMDRLKSRLFSNDFMVRYRQHANDFTRERWLTFVAVVIFLLNLLKRSQQDELDEFFKLRDGREVAIWSITKSAFTQ
jgi:hypothetical protein